MIKNVTRCRVPALANYLAAMLATGLLCACSSAPKHTSQDFPPLSGHASPVFPEDDLAEVSADMRDFLEAHLPAGLNAQQRTWTLGYIMTDPYILSFRYNPAMTLSPAETFSRRTGNCLSYSLMLVAMARHAGVPARFQEVVMEPEYDSVNDTFVNSRHINVVLGQGHETYIIDVSGRVPEDAVRTRRLSDREAYAQYYNNLGVEALLENELPVAWARFRQALETESGLAYLWSNLGVVYNRNGQVYAAELAYRTALEVDRRESIAVNNLYVIYLQEGRTDEASRLEERVERHRKRNPYYLAKLATEALASRQYDEAIDLLRRSISINNEEYRFHGALAQAQFLAGKREEALSSLDLARSLAPPGAAAELESLPLRGLPD